MLTPWCDLLPRYGLELTGVVHGGGHVGQEALAYSALGINDVLWIEANPELVPRLRENVEPFGHRVVNTCLSDVGGKEVTFHVTNNDNRSNDGQSSSMLDLKYHRVSSPDVYVDHDITVTTSTLDEVMSEYWPDAPDHGLAVNLDLQGAELMVLRGGVETLARCEMLYLEINVRELYAGCGLLPDVEAFINGHGFEIVEIELAGCQFPDCRDGGNRFTAWGDGLARRVPRPKPFREKRPDLWEAWFPTRPPRLESSRPVRSSAKRPRRVNRR